MAITSVLSSTLGSVGSIQGVDSIGSLLLAGQGRTIMGLFADVTVEEKHTDEMEMTEHPTEVGAPINDHAFKKPPELKIKVGWSESAGRLDGLVGNTVLGGDLSLVVVYETLQKLQSSTVPLIVMTGKRLYTNMLIKSLQNTTDLTSENSLMIEITFKKINLVKTSQTVVAIENQANPAETSGVSDNGTVQPKPVETSMLGKLTGVADQGGAYTLGNPLK